LKLLGWEGAEIVALPMDEEGLDLDALEAELASGGDISFLYTIPTFQNPSGRTLLAERRRRLAEICQHHDLHVLEDDPYGLVRYEGQQQGHVHALEGGSRVTFTSSFSKTVAPGLRVGYFVLTDDLVKAFDDRAVSTTISPPLLPQAVVHELFERGGFDTNLDRIKALLRGRKDAMLNALEREMPDGVSWSRPEGGYFLWVDFGDGVDAGELLARATDAGVTFVRGTDFFPPGEGGTSAARLAFSYETPERITEGVALLASLL
jgi:2-aminoadipate transaminase